MTLPHVIPAPAAAATSTPVPVPDPGHQECGAQDDHPAYALLSAEQRRSGQPAAYLDDLRVHDRRTLSDLPRTRRFLWLTRPSGTYLIHSNTADTHEILDHGLRHWQCRAYLYDGSVLNPVSAAQAREAFKALPCLYRTRVRAPHGFVQRELLRDHSDGARYVTLYGEDATLIKEEQSARSPEAWEAFQRRAAHTFSRYSRL